MSKWIQDIFEAAATGRSRVAAEQHRQTLADQAYDQQIDQFWASFLAELRRAVETFNALADEAQKIGIHTPEPAMLALRKDGQWAGQFVARLDRVAHRAEVNVIAARTITNVDCPIVVNEGKPSLPLAFNATNGTLHDAEQAARMLLDGFFRYALGLFSESQTEGGEMQRRIGF